MTVATLDDGALIASRRHMASHHAPPWWLIYLVCSAISVLAIATVLVVWLTERGEPGARSDQLDLNAEARAAANGLLAGDVDGCILTGPATAELFDLGTGWFANPGPCRRLVTRRPTRFGLPAVHAATDRVAWLEAQGRGTAARRLVLGQRASRPTTAPLVWRRAGATTCRPPRRRHRTAARRGVATARGRGPGHDAVRRRARSSSPSPG